jgi:uncharacterized protein (UPF0332 family)
MTEEQEALLRNAWASLDAARLLADRRLCGFAASRAYYAMFYVARAFILNEGLRFHKHSAVIAAFGRHFAKTGRVPVEFHRHLIDAQEARITGDYEFGKEVTPEKCARHIGHAQQFLELAAQLLGPIPDETAGTTAER